MDRSFGLQDNVMTRQLVIRRILVGGLVLALLALAGDVLYNFARSTTDENVFVTSPSRMVVRTTFGAKWKEQFRVDKIAPVSGRMPDTIETGDLLVAVNGIRIASFDEWHRELEKSSSDSHLVLSIVRPAAKVAGSFVVVRRDIDESILREGEYPVVVTEVTPGGASDRGGLLVGDLIVRINGQQFQTDFEADQILQRAQSGKSIIYNIYRNDRAMTVNVTLAEFGFPLWIGGICLSGLFTFAMGAFLALKRPSIKSALLLGLSFILLGFYFLVVAARRDVSTTFTAFRDVIINTAFFFGWALAIHVGDYFPRERPERISRPWIHHVGYGIALALSIAFPLFLQKLPYIVWVVMLAYPMVIYFKFRKSVTPEHRRMTRPIRYTSIILGAIFAVGLVGVFTGGDLWIRFAGVLIVMIPISVLITIGRYRLLDINLRIRRNLQYSFVTIGWGILAGVIFVGLFSLAVQVDFHIPVVIITGSSIEVTDAPASPEVREVVRRTLAAGMGMLAWFLIWKIRKGVQQKIDEKYYRTRYDYRDASEQLAEVMATKLTMVDLGRGIVEKLASLMQVKRAGILFFRDESLCCCQEAWGIGATEWGDFCGETSLELARAVKSFTGEIRIDYLPDRLKSVFQKHELQFLVPIRSKQHLIGVFILGEKLSESTYSQDDLAFLAAAARQASVAIENTFLYEELAEKERMKHELAIARRIQLASLPQSTPLIDGLDISGVSHPALEVGGDFFDYLNGAPGRVTVIVGDVSGKGTSAALYMSKVQGILRSLHGFDLSPGPLFVRANRLLCADLEKNSFITAVGAAFDASKRELVLARAGHLPLYRYSAQDSRVEKVTPRGLGLGLNNASLFVDELEERVIPYAKGDMLLFVTDGVTEARDAKGEEFGEDRLLRSLESRKDMGAGEFRDGLLDDLKRFVGDQPPLDDQTIVVVKAV